MDRPGGPPNRVQMAQGADFLAYYKDGENTLKVQLNLRQGASRHIE